MKLNLVPTHVAKERSGGAAIFFALILAVLGIIGAVIMVVTSGAALDKAKTDEADALQRAAAAKAKSDQADALMADAKTHAVVRNVSLAESMQKHCSAYPNLYDMLRRYIPSYYRVTSMAASPGADGTTIITMTGVVTTFQQYSDLGLAFMRIPGALGYSPSGYQINDSYVPNLTPDDMLGRRIHPGEGNIPQDEQQRLQYLQAQGTLTSYSGASGFGDDTVATKGPMPNASLVTMTVTLKSDLKNNYDVQTPDPRQTLSLGASQAATSTAGGAGGGAAGAFTPPTGNPPTTAGTGGGKAAKDTE